MIMLELDQYSFQEIRGWLFEALNDRAPVPRLSPDEPPDVAILAHEHTLARTTRRDLERACQEWVLDFTHSGEGSVPYVDALLRLAAGLGLRQLAGPLAALARRFPDLPTIPLEIKQAIALILIDLKEVQPLEFWRALLDHDAQAFAGAALSGTLARSWQAGVALLPELPDDPMFGSVIHVILGQTLEDLPATERFACLPALQDIRSSCPPALSAALERLLRAHQIIQGSTARPANRLREAIDQSSRFPAARAVLGRSLPSRLAA